MYDFSKGLSDFGYESPITVAVNDITAKINNDMENGIALEVNRQLSIEVNKDELIKALNFDRKQYSMGYTNGYRMGLEEGKRIAMTELAEVILKKYGKDKYDEEVEDDDTI